MKSFWISAFLFAPFFSFAQPVAPPISSYFPLSTQNGGTSFTVSDPTTRCPLSTDDAVSGYAVGNLWTCGSRVYQAIQVTAGKAVWQIQPRVLPLDNYIYGVTSATVSTGGTGYTTGSGTVTLSNGSILNVTASGGSVTAVSSINTAGNWGCNQPTNPVSQVSTTLGGTGATFTVTVPRFQAYGVALLTKCYATNSAYDLTLVLNGSSTVKTIGFVNGVADQATAASFCAPSPLTCYVTTEYDQGGLGNNATQSTLGNAPIFYASAQINGFNPIVHNSQQWTTGTVPFSSKYLTATSGAWYTNQFTYFMAGQNLLSTQGDIYLENTSSTYGLSTYAGFGSISLTGEGVSFGIPAETQPSILYASASSPYNLYGGSGNSLYTRNSYYSTQGPFTGINIGGVGSINTNAANFDSLAVIFSNFSISLSQQQSISASLYGMFSITPQVNSVVVFDGDSTLPGRGSVLDNSQMKLAYPSFSRAVKSAVTALSGETVSGLVSNFSVSGPGVGYKGSYHQYIVLNDAFPNDIRGGNSASTIEANIISYVNLVHALGPNAYAIWIIPMEQCDIFNNSAEFSVYQTVVNWLMASGKLPQSSGGAGLDAIANVWSDPTIGPGNFTTTPPFCSSTYSADSSQHPNDYSMQFFVPYISSAVNSLLH